jgi:hypothetical protein
MQLFPVRHSLDRRDLLLRDCSYARDARSLRTSINYHGARAAGTFATTVFTAGQVKMFTQNR